MQPHIEQKLLAAFELQNRGRKKEAEEAYRAILKSDQRNIHALNLLGIICLESDRAPEAVKLFSKAARQAPRDAETLANLGLAFSNAGRFDEAIKTFSDALVTSPPNPALHNNLGAAFARTGKYEDAIGQYKKALSLQPGYADALSNLASALSAMGQYEEARPIAERAVAAAPQSAAAHNNLGEILLKQCRHKSAADSFSNAIRLDPRLLDAALNLATVKKESGNIDEATELLSALSQQHSQNPSPAYSLGVLFEQCGEIDSAAAQYQEAIRRDPLFAEAHYQLAQLKGRAPAAGEIAAMESALKSKTLSHEQQKYFAFGVGAAFEKQSDYAKAARFFAKGHRALRDTYSHETTVNMHDRMRSAFKESVSQPTAPPKDARRPVFVLGIPRSGTSLVEQILSSHPQIAGAGESSFLADAVNQAAHAARTPFPECVGKLAPDDIARIGDNYRRRLFEQGGDAQYVIDKTPLNFQYIGFARRLLPEAKFIHCKRDPLNTCFSIYKIPFDQNQNYASSFQSLGRFYRAYEALMAHWQSQSEEDLLTVSYESLVDDVEAASKTMLSFVGVAFDESVLKFFNQKRLVRTPSAGQVRQPIYRDSIDLAQKYGAALDGLRAALNNNQG